MVHTWIVNGLANIGTSFLEQALRPKKESEKSPEKKEQKKLRYKIDFIYRRQKYTLKNLIEDYLISKIKSKIAKELNLDLKYLKFYYKENELKGDTDKNVFYQLIKDDHFPIIEVKKESLNEQNITSLNTCIYIIKFQFIRIRI